MAQKFARVNDLAISVDSGQRLRGWLSQEKCVRQIRY